MMPKPASKTSVRITPEDRAREFSGVFHASGKQLICSSCNIPVDHTRKASLEKHLITAKHRRRLGLYTISEEKPSKKPRVVKTEVAPQPQRSGNRLEPVLKLVQAFAEANIPIGKIDHPALHAFLEQNVKKVGVLPEASVLRNMYSQKVYELHVKELTEKFGRCHNVAIVVDETTDEEDRYMLNILAVPSLSVEGPRNSGNKSVEPLLEAYLIECCLLEITNFKTVSEAVLRATQMVNIEPTKVSAFVTDHAAYMYKAWERSLKPIFLNAVHVTSAAHILSIVGEIWQNAFDEVSQLIVAVEKSFSACPARKARFRNFLQEKGMKPTLPPAVQPNRWSSWFESASYHRLHLQDYAEFFQGEQQTSGSSAVEEVVELAQSGNTEEQLDVLDRYGGHVRQMLAKYELARSTAACVVDDLRELAFWAQGEAEVACTVAADALIAMATRLCQYVEFESPCRFTQPAARFLAACRMFDPAKAVELLMDSGEICNAVPLLEDNIAGIAQLIAYLDNLGEFVPSEPVMFWRKLADRFPELSRVVLACLSVPLSSVDAKKSISMYSNVLMSEFHGHK
ncbi:uncharacterized protein LOC144718613 [Lampetra planeri]